MRKFTKMMLTLALLFSAVGGVKATKLYATYGTPASNGKWDAETNTYTWTGNYSNLMTIFEFPSGDLGDYTSLHLTTSNYSDAYRVCFMNGSTAVATISFYSGGEKDIVFSERTETKDLDMSQITHISFGGSSGSGSIVLSKAYLEKPTEFKFNAAGKAYLYPSDLNATSWGIDSYDAETGVITKTTTGYGNLTFDFGEAGYDFSDITYIEVNITVEGDYTNNLEYAYVTDLNGHTQYIGTSGSYSLGNNIDSNIRTWNLGLNEKTGTMKINYVCFTSNMLKVRTGAEKAINELTSYQKDGDTYVVATSYTPSYRINESTNVAYFGVDWNGEQLNYYTDLTGCSSIRVYQPTSTPTVRCFFFNSDASDQQQFSFTWNDEGYYELNLATVQSSVNNLKLISIRPQQGQTSSVNDITVVKGDAIYDYVISGSGVAPSKLTAALADATATSYDATGLTKAIALETANPNALIVANTGMVTNDKNVIVDGVCNNLELKDGEPFKAPSAFTATNAKFTRKFSSADYATMVVPFDVATLPTQPATVKAYKLKGVNGEAITTDVLTSLTANEPVMVKVTADDVNSYEFTASGVSVAATSGDLVGNGLLKATYATTTAAADANNYVLQKNGDDVNDVNFYLVTGTSATVKPFRAYLHYENPGAHILSILFDDATGIEKVEKEASVKENGEFFNLAGQRVAQPTKGLYIVNGKKVVIK